MTTNDIYIEIINELIKRKIKILGTLALKKAGSVSNLKIDAQGNVISISGIPENIIRALISKFEELAGKPSTISSKIQINNIAKKYPDFNLPEDLKY